MAATPVRSLEVWPQYIIPELIPTDKSLINVADIAPPPCRDFAQVLVTLDEIIFRFWKISLRKNGAALPSETKQSHADFLYDDRLQSEINRLFGANMLIYVRGLAAGHIDYLVRMPQNLLIHILEFLDLEDISRLAQTCKTFNKICNCDDLWERLYVNDTKQVIFDDLRSLAHALGWRKLYFTNKLQLQAKPIRPSVTMKKKHKQKAKKAGEAKTKATETKKERGQEIYDFDFSPYPEGQSWPRFKDGPEDYSRYTLVNPREHESDEDSKAPGQEINSEEIAVIKQIQRERLRKKNEGPPKPAYTLDDWGEDFSFLNCDSVLAVAYTVR